MAGATDDKGLTAACGHPYGPFRVLLPPFGVEVFERPDVVHLDLVAGAAEFAGVGQKPLHEFRPAVAPDAGRVVVEDCRGGVPRQRDASPLRYQWCSPAITFHGD